MNRTIFQGCFFENKLNSLPKKWLRITIVIKFDFKEIRRWYWLHVSYLKYSNFIYDDYASMNLSNGKMRKLMTSLVYELGSGKYEWKVHNNNIP